MLGGGLQLALIPAPLIVAAIVVFALSPRQATPARLVAGAGIAATIALLAVEAAFLNGSGRIETSLGTPVAGIAYLLRLDLPGATLGLAASAAALLLLLERERQTREVSALLVCVAGTTLAALAGNVVMLAGGVEIAGVGHAAHDQRRPRPAGPRRARRHRARTPRVTRPGRRRGPAPEHRRHNRLRGHSGRRDGSDRCRAVGRRRRGAASCRRRSFRFGEAGPRPRHGRRPARSRAARSCCYAFVRPPPVRSRNSITIGLAAVGGIGRAPGDGASPCGDRACR